MSTTTDPASKIPHWFALLLSAVTLAGGGGWLAVLNSRLYDLEHRTGIVEVDLGKRGAQLDGIGKSVDKIDAKLDTGFASMDRRLGELAVTVSASTARPPR